MGSKYSKKSMQSIKFGLQRKFLNSPKAVDIVHHPEYKNSGRVFKAVSSTLKKEGKGAVKPKEAISEQDMAKIQHSLDLSTPQGLQDKVFFDIMLYFCNRGRENLRDMTVDSFEEHDEGGRRFITLRDNLTKNNREDDAEKSQGGIMVEIPGNPRCPVKAFLEYKMKLNPACKWFWQRPKSLESDESEPWYCNAPLGKNTLGNKVKDISKRANCSRVYTNHCLRSTSITSLDNAGFASRDIMTVSGHHSEASIKNYSRTSETKKLEMSNAIAAVINPQSAVINQQPDVVSFPVTIQQPVDVPSTSSLNASSLLDPVSSSQQSQDSDLQLIDQVLRDIGNSPKPVTIPVNISTNNSQMEENKTSQFNFQHCVVKIYNK